MATADAYPSLRPFAPVDRPLGRLEEGASVELAVRLGRGEPSPWVGVGPWLGAYAGEFQEVSDGNDRVVVGELDAVCEKAVAKPKRTSTATRESDKPSDCLGGEIHFKYAQFRCEQEHPVAIFSEAKVRDRNVGEHNLYTGTFDDGVLQFRWRFET